MPRSLSLESLLQKPALRMMEEGRSPPFVRRFLPVRGVANSKPPKSSHGPCAPIRRLELLGVPASNLFVGKPLYVVLAKVTSENHLAAALPGRHSLRAQLARRPIEYADGPGGAEHL